MQEKEQKKERHRMRRTEEVWNSPPATRRGAPLRSKTGDFFSMVQGFFPCPRESGVVKKRIERGSGRKVWDTIHLRPSHLLPGYGVS